MSSTPLPAEPQATAKSERFERPIASAVSVLVHVLALMALLYASKPILAPEQGSSGGGRTKVDFVGTSKPDDARIPVPPSGKTQPNKEKDPRKPSPDLTQRRKQTSALVTEAKDTLPDPQTAPKRAEQQPEPQQATQPAASTASEEQRRNTPWGQPPGSQQRDTAPVDNGPSYGPAPTRMPGEGNSGAAAVGAGGHQIYYDLFGDTRLRGWKESGMSEVSFPLPGLRQYMVCPLEIVLRRGDGGCRLVEPDDEALKKVGDAREVVQVIRVYRRGELIWRGPGLYK